MTTPDFSRDDVDKIIRLLSPEQKRSFNRAVECFNTILASITPHQAETLIEILMAKLGPESTFLLMGRLAESPLEIPCPFPEEKPS